MKLPIQSPKWLRLDHSLRTIILLPAVLAVLAIWPGLPARASVVFDFDTGTPALSPGNPLPPSQESGGLTAFFSSPQGSSAFSVQSDASLVWTLSKFSGNYLYPNTGNADSLRIQFNQGLVSLILDFATTDHQPIETPNSIQLTAFQNSVQVGSATAGAVYGSDSLPMGSLSFAAGGQAFNEVRIALVLPGDTPTGFLVDNISVELVPEPVHVALAIFGTLFLGFQFWRGRLSHGEQKRLAA